jgi:hypothetical protein
MNRAKELISELRLEPHPEGGYFREVFRSRVYGRPRPRQRSNDPGWPPWLNKPPHYRGGERVASPQNHTE